MINVAELVIEDILTSAIASPTSTFRANTAYHVPNIFSQLSATRQTEIATWFANPANIVTAQQGYPLQPVEMPILAVTVADMNEPETFTGMGVGDETDDSGDVTSTMASYFSTAYRIGCVATNANLEIYLQALVRWALLQNRGVLSSQYGLLDQHISGGQFVPLPDSLRDSTWPFERPIILTATNIDTWTVYTPQSDTVTGVTPVLTSQYSEEV